MIHAIRIQNYKSFRDVSLTLRPVSVLIGPNNAGKSNFLQALVFLGSRFTGHAHPGGALPFERMIFGFGDPEESPLAV
jgi:AAA15 family ATPase/GTPase